MVKAILEGRKTMTRRILLTHHDHLQPIPVDFDKTESMVQVELNTSLLTWIDCPYGKIGHTLWVRETFSEKDGRVVFRADVCSEHDLPDRHKWTPSIFMPRTLSRLTLEITDIRIEKLQDISNEDAKAEGASDTLSMKDIALLKGLNWIIPRPFLEYQFGFLALWCKINGVKSWTDNPYVWVVEFKKKEVDNV